MEHRVCTVCVMDTSDPAIEFDDAGVCNHCRRARAALAKNWFPNETGRRLMAEASAKIRAYGKDREYDCIIGVSGGVDSSYLLHVAKVEMNLRPLVIHIDAGWNSEIAVKNIEALVNKLGLDLFTHVVDWEEIRDLQVAFLNSATANQDIPQDHAFYAKLFELAVEKKIKYVLTGLNLTSESILPSSWGYDAMDAIFIRSIARRFGNLKLKNYPLIPYWKYKIYYPRIKRMEIVAPLNWIDYDKNKTIAFLEQHYEWRYYGGKHHESKWTKFFQAYFLPEKFGYDKRKAHLSSLIVAGQMTRDQALEELKKPLYDPRELADDKAYIVKKLGITMAEFDRLLKLECKTSNDFPNHQRLDAWFVGLKQRLSRVAS